MNVEKHPARIDVGYLKMGAFPQTLSTAVDGFQTGAIDGSVDLFQNPVHFLPAQDDGQLLLRTWPDKPQRGPVTLECSLIEELDAAQGDRRSRARHLPVVGQVQEILPQLFLGQLRRVALEVGEQL